MKTIINSFQKTDNLAVIEFSAEPQNSFDFISGSKAKKLNFIAIGEVSDGGDVNRISVNNLSDEYVFFSDGDLLEGAKQNRVLNTSILLKPHTTTTIPVSCVERGRWGYSKKHFDSTDFAIPPVLRVSKSKDVADGLKKNRNFEANQLHVWAKVDDYHHTHKTSSHTSNLNDIYEQRRKKIDEYMNSFNVSDKSNGMAIYINSKLFSIDIFNRTDIFQEYFNKLLRGAVLEAMGSDTRDETLNQDKAADMLNNILEEIEISKTEQYKAVGAGSEYRFDEKNVSGAKLIYEDNLIHLFSFVN